MIASASIHAGLMMTSNNSSVITLPGSTGSVMEVKIKERQDTLTKNAIVKPVSNNPSKKTAAHEVISRINKTVASSENTEKQKSKAIISAANKQHAKSKARVISILYKELNKYFIYPGLAQKRNWQGKVLLSLRVTSNGKINNVQLNSSSGYNILDQAAINSLIKVGYLPKISSWLHYDIDLKLPVVYQLTES